MFKNEITEVVVIIKSGEVEYWTNLYHLVEKHKKSMVNKFGIKLKTYCSIEDVNAWYDDILMYSVNKFNPNISDNFMAYFYKVLSTNWTTLARNSARNKRCLNSGSVSIEALDDSNNSVGDYLEDYAQREEFSAIDEQLSMYKTIQMFSQSKDKNVEYSKIITVFVENPELNTSENKNNILKALPEGTSWATARKKVERARKAFKEYLKEIN